MEQELRQGVAAALIMVLTVFFLPALVVWGQPLYGGESEGGQAGTQENQTGQSAQPAASALEKRIARLFEKLGLAALDVSAQRAGGGRLCVTVQNTAPPQGQRRRPGHGFGQQILRDIAARYDGNYTLTLENGRARAVAMVRLPAPNEKEAPDAGRIL